MLPGDARGSDRAVRQATKVNAMAVGCADQAGFRPKALPERCFLLRPLGVELHRWVQQLLLLLQLQSNRQVLL